jgi:hypothetical protein
MKHCEEGKTRYLLFFTLNDEAARYLENEITHPLSIHQNAKLQYMLLLLVEF